MPVVSVKSSSLTLRDSTPTKMMAQQLNGGEVRESVGTVVVTNGDSIASTYLLATLHSSWRITDLLLACDAITGAAADIGIYRVPADGGAVVDADLFGSAISIATAISTWTQQINEAVAADISKVEMPLWQFAGLTADPNVYYDLVATLTAAATATGDLSVKVRYVV